MGRLSFSQVSLLGVLAVGAAILVGAELLTRQPLAPPPLPSAEQAPAAAPEQIGNGEARYEIKRAADNHFYAEAQVNGALIRFLVDTGASSVVLTRDDALRAGIAAGEFSAEAIGAGGRVRLMPIAIDRLALGPLEATDVPAMVAEGGLTVSLLGQSYLAKTGSVSIQGDLMVLR
ncbi:retropepsin-like aspartic protease family protein [Sphingomonas sp.]|uniref:retropepsin-like aspartic protease family protein n=1 Tax=Sphingomonas sp. TaxID=28214 RepID=UPI002FC72EFE